MRRLLLIAAFMVLSGTLWLLWQSRYERVAGCPVLTLEDVRNIAQPVPGLEWSGQGRDSKVIVTALPGAPPVAAGFSLPFGAPIRQLHVKCHMQARDLVRGKQLWEDGRVMIEWRSADGGRRLAMDSVVSECGVDEVELPGVVIGSNDEAGFPVLRFEHLGASGSYEVHGLEITAVSESMLWRTGFWFIALGWGLWMFLVIRSWPGIPKWRALSASVIGLVIATHLVIPGPWRSTRPMVTGFWLGDAPAPAHAVCARTPGSPAMVSGQVTPEGRLPYQGSFVLKVKLALAALRPLLHMLLLLGPALLMLCLVGRGPGILLMVMLALSVELAQFLFGYGFDTTDLWDLTNDAVGIGAAVGVHAILGRRFGARVMWWPRKDLTPA